MADPGTRSAFTPAPEPGVAATAAERGWTRLLGWRRRVLVGVALLACLALAALLRSLAAAPWLELTATATADGSLRITGSTRADAQALSGHTWRSVGPASAPSATSAATTPVDAALLQRAPRWMPDDTQRRAAQAQHAALAAALATGQVALHLGNGEPTVLAATPRGLRGLGLAIWPLLALALSLLLFATIALLAKPGVTALVYGVVASAQALSLTLVAVASLPGLGLPAWLPRLDMPWRLAADALSALALWPLLLPEQRRLGRAAAAVALAGVVGVASSVFSPAWPAAQVLCGGLAAAALWRFFRARRPSQAGSPPDPRQTALARVGLTALLLGLVASAAVALVAWVPGLGRNPHAVVMGASVGWSLFVASLLLLMPFVLRSRRLWRELALLAGISTVAAALDLLFVALFSLHSSAALALAVFVALAVYAFARQRLLDQLLGARVQTTEHVFERLYRAARDVQARPERHLQRQAQLLRELFQPLELARGSSAVSRAHVADGGAELWVPLKRDRGKTPVTVRLRLAERGQRLFLPEDARLAERVLEQLGRAVAHDRAVERGRHEERQRLAQDLHDDIGARLLTLMYQAPTPELEDYIRHTLQDLKTLTRGLAVAEQKLGAAAAEWKADLGQRLAVARASLDWRFEADADADRVLSVVQWSALTRVLRELVTNALYHGHASHVAVGIERQGDALSLVVADDGDGRNPAQWAHGLGLGGVRKRVKQLGGQVQWQDNGARGIVCRVYIGGFFATSHGDLPPG